MKAEPPFHGFFGGVVFSADPPVFPFMVFWTLPRISVFSRILPGFSGPQTPSPFMVFLGPPELGKFSGSRPSVLGSRSGCLSWFFRAPGPRVGAPENLAVFRASDPGPEPRSFMVFSSSIGSSQLPGMLPTFRGSLRTVLRILGNFWRGHPWF